MINLGSLKKEADLSGFIRQIEKCQGDILFRTNQGDVLNLRSTLSAYVFAALAGKPELLYAGWVECCCAEDAGQLGMYFVNPIDKP